MEMLGSLQRMTVAVLGITVLSLAMVLDARADFGFAMNFTPAPAGQQLDSWANLDCRDPYAANTGNSGDPCIRGGYKANEIEFLGHPYLDPDKTPFFQEIIRGADGHDYYHVIVGDLGTEFIQEYYIRVIGVSGNNSCCYSNGVPFSWSAGAIINGGYDIFDNASTADPLDQTDTTDWWRGSGNATANPEFVIFRQIIKDGDMFQETEKGTGIRKPRINQVITDNIVIHPDNSYTVVNPAASGIISRFEFDMSSVLLDDNLTSGVMTNQLTVVDPNNHPISDLGDFDVVAQGQIVHATGGQYVYNPDPWWVGGTLGTYTYSEGEFDPYAIDWHDYLNPANNNVPNQ